VRTITVAGQFRGPPLSGNGGYLSGLLADEIDGPAKVMLRAIIPLDTPLTLMKSDGRVTVSGADGTLIATAEPASADMLPRPPAPPSLAEARAAQERFPFYDNRFHPVCFTCSVSRGEGDALRVFPGQLEGAAPGNVAGVWIPHPSFARADGTIPDAITWAAIDCPGSVAWIVRQGSGGGLLGTMTGDVLRRPRAGETTIVTAWPLTHEGRKFLSGVAMFTAHGELLARGHQIWIGRPPQPAAA
jgi:hypothetical protein